MKFKLQTFTIIDGWIDAGHAVGGDDDGKLITYDSFGEAMDELKRVLAGMEESDMDFDECDWRVVPEDYYDSRGPTVSTIRNPG